MHVRRYSVAESVHITDGVYHCKQANIIHHYVCANNPREYSLAYMYLHLSENNNKQVNIHSQSRHTTLMACTNSYKRISCDNE